MVKRTLMALRLGVALLGGGVANTVHASSVVAAHPAAVVHADLVAGDTGDTTPDADANAPCATDPTTGDQTGNCQDSQNQSGPQDTAGDQGGADTGGADQGGTPTPGTPTPGQ